MNQHFCFFVLATMQHVGSQFPDQGLNLCPLQLKCRVLPTGPPGKFQKGNCLGGMPKILSRLINENKMKKKVTENFPFLSMSHIIQTVRVWRALILFISVSPGGSDGKESMGNAGDPGSIPGSGRSPGEENGNPSQYSCLENPMDRGACCATVHWVSKSQTEN